MAESLKRLKAAGYQIYFHVHDEVILDVLKDKTYVKVVTNIMGQTISCALGLLLRTEGYVTVFYKKE